MIRAHQRINSVSIFLAAMMLVSPQMQAGQAGQQLSPIPKMQTDWPSLGLNDHDYRLLVETVKPVCGGCDGSAIDFRFEYAIVGLGHMGKGVLVRMLEPHHCGGTGNCAIHVYVRDSDKYREVPFEQHREPWGWAWGIVEHDSPVPELVFGSNGGGSCQSLSLYRYSKGTFLLHGMESIRLKDESHNPEPGDWWSSSVVTVHTNCDASLHPTESLQILRPLHSRWVAMLEHVSDQDWRARGYIHPETGPHSLEQVFAMYAWHSVHHLAQLRQFLRFQDDLQMHLPQS